MPNMSRHGLEHHQTRVDDMAINNPSQESYIRSRYQAKNYDARRTATTRPYYYDSQDEVDQLDVVQKQYSSSVSQKSVIRRLFTSIITWVFTSWYRVTSLFKRNDRNLYYTRTQKEGKQRKCLYL